LRDDASVKNKGAFRAMLACGLVVFGGLLAPLAGAARPTSIVVTIKPAHRATIAPGRLIWTIRIANHGSSRLAGLSLGESVVINGDPGHYGRGSLPGGGECGGAAGTLYCPLAPLGPGQGLTAQRVSEVPSRFPGGPSNIGATVQISDFVVDGNGHTLGSARQSLTIAPNALPYTGADIASLASVSALLLAAGGSALVIGHSRRRTAS
jgi:hypothetical protein